MAVGGKRGGKRRGVARRPRRRMMNKRNNVADKASCSVTRTLAMATTNTMYAFNSFNLADYQRAVNIAGSYQRYRITGIKLTFKPEYDTYAAGAGSTKPFLYYIIDKSGSLPDNLTLEGLKQSGARPHAFDEKPLVVRWRPSVLTEEQTLGGAAQGAGFKVSPWLSTDATPGNPGVWVPSNVNHLGIKWYMETAGSALNVYLEAELQFEFIKPIYPQLASVPAKGLEYAKLDASPDGVEGGSDGITVPTGL